ncbi:MAG: hypothetical protein EOP16_02965 [Pseudonocardia sp.]|nr:MAG: hypothetical protein EOP16_02965 [Pseudonocardia sp.]
MVSGSELSRLRPAGLLDRVGLMGTIITRAGVGWIGPDSRIDVSPDLELTTQQERREVNVQA